MKSDGYRRLDSETSVTAAARRCRDRVQLGIGLAEWFTVECSAWERVRWEICAITLGDGRTEPFGLLKLYWTPSSPGGGEGMGLPWSPLDTAYAAVMDCVLLVVAWVIRYI